MLRWQLKHSSTFCNFFEWISCFVDNCFLAFNCLVLYRGKFLEVVLENIFRSWFYPLRKCIWGIFFLFYVELFYFLVCFNLEIAIWESFSLSKCSTFFVKHFISSCPFYFPSSRILFDSTKNKSRKRLPEYLVIYI